MNEKKNIAHSAKWKSWKSSAEKHGLNIRSAHCLNWIEKSNSEDFLFGFFQLDAISTEGTPFPPNLLIRGDAVVVLPVIKDTSEGTLYTVLVSQLRSATGGTMLELPAGMLDSPFNDPKAKAYSELIEETEMDFFKPSDLQAFPIPPVYTSPGLLDEKIYYYYAEASCPIESLTAWQNRSTGCHDENEHIRVHILPFTEAISKSLSIPALFGLYWYQTHRMNQFI